MRFFKSQAEFRKWLERNHDREDELWVGLFKKTSGKGGITYEEAVDQGLCWGWIDGLTKGVDDVSYKIRFTPRRKKSNWSAINVEKVKKLRRAGLMAPPGLEVFEARDRSVAPYSYEQEVRKLGPSYEKRFKAQKKAWAFFQAQPPGYRKTAALWVMSAKREETRLKRLDVLIEDSKSGLRLENIAGRPDRSP